MSDRNPKELPILLLGVFVLTIIMMNNYNDFLPLPDENAAKTHEARPVQITALAKNRKGYGIASIDANTGRRDGKRIDLVYREYDICLMALFKRRAAILQVDTQQKMQLICEKTGF